MSLINLLITISKVISDFLLYKKMHKDIVRSIITQHEGKKIIHKENNMLSKGKRLNQIYSSKDKENKKEKNDKNTKVKKKFEVKEIFMSAESKRTFVTSNINNSDAVPEVEITDIKIENIMKNLSVLNVIKSFFCKRNKKLKLINLCDKVVNKELCIEQILKRLYTIENFCNSIKEVDKYNLYNNRNISLIK